MAKLQQKILGGGGVVQSEQPSFELSGNSALREKSRGVALSNILCIVLSIRYRKTVVAPPLTWVGLTLQTNIARSNVIVAYRVHVCWPDNISTHHFMYNSNEQFKRVHLFSVVPCIRFRWPATFTRFFTIILRKPLSPYRHFYHKNALVVQTL